MLFRKEMIQLVKNPKVRIMLFVPPAVQLVILAYAATMDLNHIDFAVLDRSHCAASRELVSHIAASKGFFEQRPIQSETEMKERLSQRKILVAFVIPERFTRAIAGREVPEIQILVDGRNTNSAGLASGYALKAVEKFNLAYFPHSAGIHIQTRAWYNPNYESVYYMVPAILVIIALLDLLLLTSLSIAREREDGTFDQLLLTPCAAWEILAAKGFSTIFVGTIQLTVGVLVALFWFQVPMRGSWFLLYGLFFSFLFSSIGLGLLISVLSKTLQQAMLAAFFLAVPMAMLSGLATPIESMSDFFQTVTLANPIRFGIAALQRIFLEGVSFQELLPTFGILWTIALVSLCAAHRIFSLQRSR